MMTDQNANVVARHDFQPYGEEIPANTAGRSSQWGPGNDTVYQRFTGQYHDSETSLDYFNARYMGPALGRFVSPDPANIGAHLLNPQSWNAYSYVWNNPLALIDPTGTDICSDGSWASACVTAPDPCKWWQFWCGSGGGSNGGGDSGWGGFPGSGGGGSQQVQSAPPPPPPTTNVFGPPKNGIAQQIKQAYCSVVPTGRSTSVSVAFGAVGAVSGEIDTVLNYNSGQTSLFATGGVSGGWNGGVSLTASSGLVYGLDQTNNGFSGPFKGASFYVPTPIPGVGAGGSVISGGGVTVVSAGASAGLVGKYGGGISATTTSRALNTGRFTGFSSSDYLGYLLRRPCN